ncbi:MAG: hypothetical protein IH788_02895, partial [Nitrospinae bacterium]|nr:hypothetical protein [Nitrospinota bacterium]
EDSYTQVVGQIFTDVEGRLHNPVGLQEDRTPDGSLSLRDPTSHDHVHEHCLKLTDRIGPAFNRPIASGIVVQVIL